MGVLTTKTVFRCITAVFFVQTIFFLTFPTFYMSLYKQTLLPFDAYGSFNVYDGVRNIVYLCSFGTGLLLVARFPRDSKDAERIEEMVAINCALQGFFIQAIYALWIHETGYRHRYIYPRRRVGLLIMFEWINLAGTHSFCDCVSTLDSSWISL